MNAIMKNIHLIINLIQENEINCVNSGHQSPGGFFKIDLKTRMKSKKRNLNQNNKGNTFRNKYSECL